MTVRLKDEAALKAASATKLATARKIGNASFDGTADISLSAMGAVGLASPAFTGTPTAPTAATGTNTTQVATTAFVTTAVNNKTSVSGNAGTATKLQTARTINGTSFDGTANITTANWGTARNLTIGNKAKSVNGSANVAWTLDEIGASDKSLHKNNYVRVTVGGDAATYYPVVISFSKTAFPFARLNISRSYSWTAPDTWNNATHKGGLTLAIRWNGDNYWGGNAGHTYDVESFNETYTTMVAGLDYCTGGLVVWLRGGTALYQIDSDYGTGVTATVYTTTYTDSASRTYAPRTDTSKVNSEIKARWNTRGSSGVYDNNNRVYSPSNPQTTITGNAGTATVLQTARTINGTSFNGSANITTANWGTARTLTIGNSGKSVNGSGNVSWTLAEIGAAAASHGMHPASKSITTGFDTTFRTSTKGDANSGAYISTVRTDTASVTYAPQYSSGLAWGQGDTHGYLNVSYSSGVAYLGGGSSNKLNWVKQLAFTDSSITGNAKTATTLQTARTINGTSFNGSANITTANWGTARTLTVGNTGKSVNGSGNISWSLSEIGALPLTGGTMTGTIKSSLSTGTWLAGNQGTALLNSTNTAGTFTTLIKSNSTNGYFAMSNYNSNLYLTYTAKSTVDAGTNQTTKAAVLLNESGDSTFPGTITVQGGLSSSVLNGTDKNIIKADAWQTYVGSTTSETRLQGTAVMLLGDMHTNKRIYLTEDRAFISANTWAINNNGDTSYSNMYIGPSASGEARVVAYGDSSALTYRPIRASQFNASGGSILNNSLTLAGNAVVMNGTNGSIGVANGYMVVRTNDTAGYVYLQGAEVRATKLNSTSTYTHFRCGALTSNGNITTSGNVKSGNVYMNGANSIRNDTQELYLAGTSTSYPNYLGSMGISADSAGGRWYSASIYNRKYTASANMHITSAGTVGYTSSARRYKLDIKDVDADKPELILNLEPKTWFDKTATEQYANYLTMKAKGRSIDLEHEDIPYMDRQNGLIAEDVEEAGLGQFVNYGDPDEDGNREVMGIQYDRLWTLLIPVVRDLKKTVEAQQTEINELKALLKEQAA